MILIIIATKLLGGIAFLSVFTLNIIMFVQNDTQTGDLSLTALIARADGGETGGGGPTIKKYKTVMCTCTNGDEGVRLTCTTAGNLDPCTSATSCMGKRLHINPVYICAE